MSLRHLESLRSSELKKVLITLSELKSNMDRGKLKVLEIGAGTGCQARELAENGYAVEAIDILDSTYLEDRVWPIRNYDGKHIPFTSNSFDIVFSSNVLEHIPHLDEFHSEMQRVLKPDGIAIHIVPSASWKFWTILTHYCFVFTSVIKILRNRICINSKKEMNIELSRVFDRATRQSRIQLVRKVLFPSRHGEAGDALTEVYYLSRHRWIKLFKTSGWEVRKVVPNRLFYTGYMVLDSNLPIELRRYISSFLGSSCHIFVLAKQRVS